MLTFTTIVHVFVSILLICAILLQSGRGGGLAGLGGAAAGQVFGGRGAGNFLTRLTTTAAIVFFLTSMVLSFGTSGKESVITRAKSAEQPAAAADATKAEAAEEEDTPQSSEGLPATTTEAETTAPEPATAAPEAAPAAEPAASTDEPKAE